MGTPWLDGWSVQPPFSGCFLKYTVMNNKWKLHRHSYYWCFFATLKNFIIKGHYSNSKLKSIFYKNILKNLLTQKKCKNGLIFKWTRQILKTVPISPIKICFVYIKYGGRFCNFLGQQVFKYVLIKNGLYLFLILWAHLFEV